MTRHGTLSALGTAVRAAPRAAAGSAARTLSALGTAVRAAPRAAAASSAARTAGFAVRTAAFAALAALLTLSACGHPAPPANSSGGGANGDGLAAFETVRSVLQHPRCQNCHPRGDVPLQGDDGHPHLQNVQRGPDGRGMVGERCTTCHGPANPPDSYGGHTPPGIVSGWRMPKPDERLVFVGVAPGALCEQIKDPAHNGGKDMAALRAHLDDPLVQWGWTPGFGRAPVPVPRETFLAAWTTWANAGAPCPK